MDELDQLIKSSPNPSRTPRPYNYEDLQPITIMEAAPVIEGIGDLNFDLDHIPPHLPTNSLVGFYLGRDSAPNLQVATDDSENEEEMEVDLKLLNQPSISILPPRTAATFVLPAPATEQNPEQDIMNKYCQVISNGDAQSNDPQKKKIVRNPVSGRYSCGYCTAEYTTDLAVQEHYLKKHGQLRFKCILCKQIFGRKTKFHSHYNAVHAKVKVGAKSFNHPPPSSRPEMKRPSPPPPQYKCRSCGRIFLFRSSMHQHEKICTGPEQPVQIKVGPSGSKLERGHQEAPPLRTSTPHQTSFRLADQPAQRTCGPSGSELEKGRHQEASPPKTSSTRRIKIILKQAQKSCGRAAERPPKDNCGTGGSELEKGPQNKSPLRTYPAIKRNKETIKDEVKNEVDNNEPIKDIVEIEEVDKNEAEVKFEEEDLLTMIW